MHYLYTLRVMSRNSFFDSDSDPAQWIQVASGGRNELQEPTNGRGLRVYCTV